VTSAATAAVTLPMWLGGDSLDIQASLEYVSAGLILALGVYFLIRNSRMGPSRNFNPVMAIQVAYLANAVPCLIGSFQDWGVGAYCILVAAIAFVLQIVLVSVPGRDVVES
jgi:O-antigen ligase